MLCFVLTHIHLFGDIDFCTQAVMMLTGTALFVNVDRHRARLASGYEEIGTKDY